MPYRKVPGLKDIYRRGGILYRRVYFNWLSEHGKQKKKEVFRSLGERKYNRRAKEVEKLILREFFKLDPTRKNITWGEGAEECWRIKFPRKRRDSTIKSARLIYDRLIDAFGFYSPDEVTDSKWLDQLEEWRGEPWRGAKISRKSFSHVRVYARQIDRFLVKSGYKRQENEFPINDPDPREGRVISPGEIKILQAYSRTLLHREKERYYVPLFLLFGWGMGMRKGEIIKLTWDRVDLKRKVITLRAGDVKTGSKKGGRRIGIAPSVYSTLIEWRVLNKTPWVFPNPKGTGPMGDIKRVLWRISKKTGIPFSPHDLRHSFLTRKLLHEKKNPLDVSVYAGVSLTVIQKRYLHPRADDTRHIVDMGESDHFLISDENKGA